MVRVPRLAVHLRLDQAAIAIERVDRRHLLLREREVEHLEILFDPENIEKLVKSDEITKSKQTLTGSRISGWQSPRAGLATGGRLGRRSYCTSCRCRRSWDRRGVWAHPETPRGDRVTPAGCMPSRRSCTRRRTSSACSGSGTGGSPPGWSRV